MERGDRPIELVVSFWYSRKVKSHRDVSSIPILAKESDLDARL